MNIPVVIGTAREGRQSEKVAAAVAQVLKNKDIKTSLEDVKSHLNHFATIPPWGSGGADEKPTSWKEVVEKADALILVVPEYNHGYPGELKLLLDSLYDEYAELPVGIVGVSGGIFGGARVVDHIKPVLIELNMIVIKQVVHVLKASESVTESGGFSNQKTTDSVEKMADSLCSLGQRLQSH